MVTFKASLNTVKYSFCISRTAKLKYKLLKKYLNSTKT